LKSQRRQPLTAEGVEVNFNILLKAGALKLNTTRLINYQVIK
jgi:hypothetical protein